MKSTNCTDLVKRLRDAIIAGDVISQAKAFQALDMTISDELVFSADCFSALLDTMSDRAAGQASESSHLIKLFEYNRDLLDDQQSQRLNECLESAYINFVDPASLILILELLVDSHQSDEALSILKKLSAEAKPPALALIPYGLQYLCKKCPNLEIAKQAKCLVEAMAKDRSESVRKEAEVAMVKIDKMLAAK